LPIARIGEPIEIAYMALFLASDEASYCTGAEFVVDGGWTCGDLEAGLPGSPLSVPGYAYTT
jgi:3alpha(or 20beta)-hydroxysteroid dehydrogenase